MDGQEQPMAPIEQDPPTDALDFVASLGRAMATSATLARTVADARQAAVEAHATEARGAAPDIAPSYRYDALQALQEATGWLLTATLLDAYAQGLHQLGEQLEGMA